VPDLDAVPQKLLDASVPFGPDDELVFRFDANVITPAWFDAQTRGLEAGEILTVSNSLAQVIVDWNLTVGGEPVPVDGKTLARFPMSHLNALMSAITEQPTRAEGEVSSEPSSPRQPEARSDSTPPSPENRPALLNGEATSASQKSSESLSKT